MKLLAVTMLFVGACGGADKTAVVAPAEEHTKAAYGESCMQSLDCQGWPGIPLPSPAADVLASESALCVSPNGLRGVCAKVTYFSGADSPEHANVVNAQIWVNTPECGDELIGIEHGHDLADVGAWFGHQYSVDNCTGGTALYTVLQNAL